MFNDSKSLKFILDIFLPRFCEHCSKKLTISENYLCTTCFNSVKKTTPEFINREYLRKFENEKYIKSFYSSYIFQNDGALQSLLHSLKYNSNYSIGRFIGKTCALNLNLIQTMKIDLIVPVPLFRMREIERGYNQSELIAAGLAAVLKIPVEKHTLKRIKNTQTQTALDKTERKQNMEGAFIFTGKLTVTDKNILLVDDVITTGATTNECARILYENNAAEIHAFSFAIADLI